MTEEEAYKHLKIFGRNMLVSIRDNEPVYHTMIYVPNVTYVHISKGVVTQAEDNDI